MKLDLRPCIALADHARSTKPHQVRASRRGDGRGALGREHREERLDDDRVELGARAADHFGLGLGR